MNEELLREYVKNTLREAGHWRHGGKTYAIKDEKTASWWKRFKKKYFSMFSDPAEEIAEDWIEDRETYDDMEFDDDTKKKILDYANKKFPRIASRTKGNVEMAKSKLRSSLSTKFAAELTALKRAAREREREEDTDID